MNYSDAEGLQTKQGKLEIEGYDITFNYADRDNPEALSELRSLLEKQRIAPEKAPKFDANKKKCDNNGRKCTLKTE